MHDSPSTDSIRRLADYPDLLTDEDLCAIYRIALRTLQARRRRGTLGPRQLAWLKRTPKVEVLRDLERLGDEVPRRFRGGRR